MEVSLPTRSNDVGQKGQENVSKKGRHKGLLMAESCKSKSDDKKVKSGSQTNCWGSEVSDSSQSGSGGRLPPKGHPKDPAWICAQGPIPKAHNDKVSLSGSHSFERFGEVGGWAVEEGNVGDCSLVLVDVEIRVPEKEAFEAHQSNANCSR